MDTINGLIFGIMVMMFATAAQAFPKTTTYAGVVSGVTQENASYGTASGACDTVKSVRLKEVGGASSGYSFVDRSPLYTPDVEPYAGCNVRRLSPNGAGFEIDYFFQFYSKSSCPPGSTLNPVDTNDCLMAIDDNDIKCDSWAVLKMTIGGGDRGAVFEGDVNSGVSCLDLGGTIGLPGGKGCKVAFTPDMRMGSPVKKTFGTFEGLSNTVGGVQTFTSSSCALGSAKPAPETVKPNKCKDGYPGQVNGAEVCVPISKDTVLSTDKGTKTVTQTPDGPRTENVTSNTVCTGAGSCTTTTTSSVSTNGGPVAATQSQVTQPKGDFCKSSPSDKLCSGPGVSGDGGGSFSASSCKVEPTCSGDALQCAIAKSTFQTKCALSPLAIGDDDSLVKAGMQAFTGAVSDADNVKKQTVQKSIGDLDQSNPFGNSGGMSDQVVSLGSRVGSLTIPWSQYNGVLLMMGRLLVGFTLLVSAFYVAKGAA